VSFFNIGELDLLSMPKAKRNKMEIYNDILSALKQEELSYREARPTRIQSKSNLAYDRLTRYLNELETQEMITNYPLTLTQKGRDFLQDYDRIKDFLEEMGIKYLTITARGQPH
jgi:predicted transcriptional regulator